MGVDLVLFDLGGVLIELGGVGELGDLAGIQEEEEIWRRWLSCPWVKRFDSGTCSPEGFADGVIEHWGLPLARADFLERFRRWPLGTFPGTHELVGEVRERVAAGALSNTNTYHWEHLAHTWRFEGLFDHLFLSFEIGHVKPDREDLRPRGRGRERAPGAHPPARRQPHQRGRRPRGRLAGRACACRRRGPRRAPRTRLV